MIYFMFVTINTLISVIAWVTALDMLNPVGVGIITVWVCFNLVTCVKIYFDGRR